MNKNPLQEIINYLPWEVKLIDIYMTDDIRKIIDSHLPYTNAYIINILQMLAEQGYCLVVEVDGFYGVKRI